MSLNVSTRQLLHTGALILGDGGRARFDVRFLGADDLPALEPFREKIFAALPDIDAYYPETPEFVGWHLAERGRTIGVFCQGRLIACAVIGIPMAGMPSFAADLPDLSLDPLTVAHMNSCMVDPQYRGNGLQRLLVSLRLMMAVGLGRQHLMTRVAVINHVSLANMLASGFLVRRIIVMHGTRLRYAMHRDLGAPPPVWDETRALAVPLADVERQRAVLQAGMLGVAVAGPADSRRILFIEPTAQNRAAGEGGQSQCRSPRLSSMLTPPVC